MKIIFLTHFYHPHVGGVEKHVAELARNLKTRGFDVTILTEKYDNKLKSTEMYDGIKIFRIPFPHIKYLGILSLWFWIFKNRKIIADANIVHCHDVFIWYLPFRFIYFNKKIVTTIHGLEWSHLLSRMSVWQKQLAIRLSNKSVGVGRFLEKYLRKKFNLITYGASRVYKNKDLKIKNNFVFVGRLEEDTGLTRFLKWLETNRNYHVDFCGDGVLRKECGKYGSVHGFVEPIRFLRKANYCVPGGYLAALEALNINCNIKIFWNDKIKKDYWQMSPFVQKDVKIWSRQQTWEKLTDEHINLYNNIK